MQTGEEPCTGLAEKKCKGACHLKESSSDYNKRVTEAIQSLNYLPSFMIFDKGLQVNDHSVILVEKGKLTGMGYLPENFQFSNLSTIKEFMTPYKENSFIRNLVAGYAAANPSKVIPLEENFDQSVH
jgi:DNA polymerase-3 subunit epsilon